LYGNDGGEFPSQCVSCKLSWAKLWYR